jgi:hypothetical protein
VGEVSLFQLREALFEGAAIGIPPALPEDRYLSTRSICFVAASMSARLPVLAAPKQQLAGIGDRIAMGNA